MRLMARSGSLTVAAVPDHVMTAADYSVAQLNVTDARRRSSTGPVGSVEHDSRRITSRASGTRCDMHPGRAQARADPYLRGRVAYHVKIASERRTLSRWPRSESDLSWAIAIGLIAVVALALVNIPFLTSFALSGDDYALVQHSARFFSPSLTDWIGHGYRWYNLTYPELGSSYTNFIRPTLNAVVYLTSWVSPSPRSALLLLPNYLGHGVCVALVFLVGRSVFGLSRRGSALASGLFLGSVTIGTDPQRVAYGGDMIAALFALLALLILHSYLTRSSSPWKIALTGVSLLLALFAKESAIGTPVILAIDILWTRWRSAHPELEGAGSAPSPPRRLGLVTLAIVIPTALYATARLAAGLHGMYVVEDLPQKVAGIPIVLLNPLRFLGTAFFPVETGVLKTVVGGSSVSADSLLGIVRGILAVGLNAIGWLLVLRLLLTPSERMKSLALLGMGLAASAVPLVLKAEPRIMYLSQALLLPLFVLALTSWWAGRTSERKRQPGWLAPVAVAGLVLIGPVYYFAQEAIAQTDLVSESRMTARTQAAILAAVRDPEVHRLYLVNATSTMSPGLNALRFLATLGGRPDLRLRVVNTFTGEVPSNPERGSVEFVRRGDELTGRIRVGSSQRLFRDLTPEDAHRLGQPGMIEYGAMDRFRVNSFGEWEFVGRELKFRIPFASRNDYAIMGLDPARSGVFALEPPSLQWERVS
jgi:hypothetical protein